MSCNAKQDGEECPYQTHSWYCDEKCNDKYTRGRCVQEQNDCGKGSEHYKVAYDKTRKKAKGKSRMQPASALKWFTDKDGGHWVAAQGVWWTVLKQSDGTMKWRSIDDEPHVTTSESKEPEWATSNQLDVVPWARRVVPLVTDIKRDKVTRELASFKIPATREQWEKDEVGWWQGKQEMAEHKGSGEEEEVMVERKGRERDAVDQEQDAVDQHGQKPAEADEEEGQNLSQDVAIPAVAPLQPAEEEVEQDLPPDVAISAAAPSQPAVKSRIDKGKVAIDKAAREYDGTRLETKPLTEGRLPYWPGYHMDDVNATEYKPGDRLQINILLPGSENKDTQTYLIGDIQAKVSNSPLLNEEGVLYKIIPRQVITDPADHRDRVIKNYVPESRYLGIPIIYWLAVFDDLLSSSIFVTSAYKTAQQIQDDLGQEGLDPTTNMAEYDVLAIRRSRTNGKPGERDSRVKIAVEGNEGIPKKKIAGKDLRDSRFRIVRDQDGNEVVYKKQKLH